VTHWWVNLLSFGGGGRAISSFTREDMEGGAEVS
jgi:hypothetical protein